MFTPNLWNGWHLPIGFFLTSYVPNTLYFQVKLKEYDPLLRVPPFRSSLSDIFPEKDPKVVGWIFSHWKFPRELLRFSFRPIFSEVSALFSMLLIFTCSFGDVLFGLFVFCSPLFLDRYPKFLEGLICSCDWCPRKSDPCILFPPSCDGEGFNGTIPFYLMVFLF